MPCLFPLLYQKAVLKGYSWRLMGVTPQPNDFIGFSAEYSESTRTPEALIYRLTEGSYPPFASCILKGRGFKPNFLVRNQSVLMRGVNDTSEKIQMLVKRLSYINVQPYYVYQHDMVQGVEDLRTSVQTAIAIEKDVRGVTAGFNTPTFAIDAPGGGGKRCIHSYEYYNDETGVSVYTAPSVKPGKCFLYFDPLHSLSAEIQQAWRDEKKRQEMCLDAIYHSGVAV